MQELLDLTRIESGQMTLTCVLLPASQPLEVVERRLGRQAERAEITLVTQVEPDLPEVYADPGLLERALLNLVQNAIPFTPRGGRVTLGVALHERGVVFTVADTGIGIAPAELDRIFERFYKVDRSRASRGTGLGLAIAKHIVQAHGGHVWADSGGEGQGSTFSFTLPTVPPPEEVQ